MNYFVEANKSYINKEYEKAFKLYFLAADCKENEAQCFYNAAVCLIKLCHYEKAIALIKKALTKRQDSKYYFNLAYCYSSINNTGKALIYFNKAWALNNEDKDCEKAINILLNSISKK